MRVRGRGGMRVRGGGGKGVFLLVAPFGGFVVSR